MEFSRQEYWSGLLFPSPGDLPYPGIKTRSPALQVDSLPPSESPGKPEYIYIYVYMCVNMCVCVYSYVHTCIYTCIHTHIHISSPAWEETCDRGEGYFQMSFFTTSYCIIWNRWSCSLRVTHNRVLIILHNHQLLVWSLVCVQTQKSDIVDMPILLGKNAVP